MEAENGSNVEHSGRVPLLDGPTNPMVTSLLTDLYQFTMAYSYWKAGKQHERAVFDLYFQKNPFGGEYTIFAGLEECIRFIATFKLAEEEISFVRKSLPSSCEGSDGGIEASKYCYIGGFDGTSMSLTFIVQVIRSGIPNFCAVALSLFDLGFV